MAAGRAGGLRGMVRRPGRWHLLLPAVLGVVVLWVATSSGAPVVPVPEPMVVVTTKSGNVVKTTKVLIGGIPVPIDVDGHDALLGADIDVSIGLVALEELPNVVVPNVVVRRNAQAQARGTKAPPLEITTRIVLHDLGSLSHLATIDYGFKTPPGAVMPPVVAAKLVGPVTGGFIDPLQAKIDTPGYGGPLDVDIKTLTKDLDASFALKFDPLPERVSISEDPRDDGLELVYDHAGGPDPDVAFDAATTLRDRGSGRTQRITAGVERLPRHLSLDYTGSDDRTAIDYVAQTARAKPDIEASYTDTAGDGDVATHADIELAGVPERVAADVATRGGSGGSREIDGAAFEVLSAGRIDQIDFEARNWATRPAGLPLYDAGPRQLVTMASRRDAGGATRFRAAGRLQGVRQIEFARTGGARDALAVRTLVGDGRDALRGVLDIDDRGPEAGDDAKRQLVDTTVRPLPARLDVLYEPATDDDPLHLVYDSSTPVQVDSELVMAEGPADDCGADRVVCATAAVDDLPPHLDVKLPSKGGTDFSVSHDADAARRPNVRAAVDVGPDSTKAPAPDRVWLRAALEDVPNQVRGRMDTRGGELRAAEFHGCAYDFDAGACPSGARPDAIGDVSFTVRDRPSRTGLPPRPDVPEDFVTLVSRQAAPAPKRFEVAGHVREVRAVAFHQMDRVPGDGRTDGVLGARVDVGSGGDPFAVAVDDEADAMDDSVDPAVRIGRKTSEVRVDVTPLPATFEACVRSPEDVAPPDPGDLPDDPLLEECQRTDKVAARDGEPVVTPLAAHYSATDEAGDPVETAVRARIKATKPDTSDLDALENPHPVTTYLDVDVPELPGTLRADVVPPADGRRLQANYEADGKIGLIDVRLEQRRATSVCEDPRPNRKALCLQTTLKDLPGSISTTYDPDPASGQIDVRSTPSTDGSKLSVVPLHLSKVAPEATSRPLVVDARIAGITEHLRAHVQERELDGENLPGRPTLAEQLASCSNGIDDDGDSTAEKPGHLDAQDEDCKADTARLEFDACPDGDCEGIGAIVASATDQLVPDPEPGDPTQPPGPPPVAPPDPTVSEQEFSFEQSGEYRARVAVSDFKRLAFSKVTDEGEPSRVTRIAAGLGNGEPMKVHIDRDTGRSREQLDATVTDAPETIELCLREPADRADLADGGDDFCGRRLADGDDREDADKLALQARVTGADPDRKPDIDVSRFELSKGGGFEVLAGRLDIDDLAERIDLLVGKDDGTEVLVEGHRVLDDREADPVAVAARVTVAIRNFRDVLGLSGYPWDPSTPGALDPKDDPRNDDGGRRNYLQLVKDHDGRLLAEASVPDIRRIHLAPRPCDPDSAITPATGFGSRPLPDYKCVRAVVAPGRPLGLAVRTQEGNPGGIDIDPDLEALDLEEGHITQMPGSLEVTLTKSPDSQKTLPRCSDPAPAPCRPPLLSLESSGNEGSQLQARLATGNTADLEALRRAQPDDVLSRRVGFEDAPRQAGFPRGARVKVGTNEETGDSALRLAAKLDLPRYLDLDPLVQFDCTHLEPTPDPATGCDAEDVGSEHNRGYETRDLAFRLVAADDKHFGTPAPARARLGRVALMAEPLSSKSPKAQIVLSGMPQPDGKDPVRALPALGASSMGSGRLPGEQDPSNKGFDAPGHLDARLFFRNDFNSADAEGNANGRSQTKYTQIDGRVNVPLSMAVRINDRPPKDQEALKAFVGSMNRARQTVPTTQLSLFNAPSSNHADSYERPTFRVRAELRKGFQGPSDPGVLDSLIDLFVCGGGADGPICLVVPDRAQVRYLDVQLNADPASDGAGTTGGAARTVDVVGGPFGAESNVDLRGFREVRPPGDKGPVANITPAAAARLTNFNLGLRADVSAFGLGVEATYEMLGDLILGLAGPSVDRVRLGQNKTSVELKSEDESGPGVTRALSDLRARQHLQIKAKLLFGSIDLVNLRFAEFQQPVLFSPCGSPLDLTEDLFGTAGNKRAAMSLSLSSIFGVGATNAPLALLSDRVKGLGCTSLFATSTSELVSRSNPVGIGERSPAPGYSVGGHPVPDQDRQDPQPLPATPLPENVPGETLVVTSGSAPRLCGAYLFEQVVVQSGGTLAVGKAGETDFRGRTCDGTLTIEADRVTVHSGGTISAGAAGTGGVGGRLVLVAGDLRNEGTIAALGGTGDAVAVDTGGACLTGGAGRQGGQLELSANLIEGTGTITAQGGTGGDGGIGGTGGIGGRVRLNTVAAPDQTISAAGGEGGGSDTGFCDGAGQHPRQKGAAGADGQSTNAGPEMASEVALAPATPGPYTDEVPRLRVKALSRVPDAAMSVMVCARRGEFSDEKPFGRHLDPFSTVSHELFMDETDRCFEVEMPQPTSGHHTYETTVPVQGAAVLQRGVYGFFGFARRPFCENLSLRLDPEDGDGWACVSGVSGSGNQVSSEAQYVDQEELLPVAKAKIGYDPVAPPAPSAAGSGPDGCFGGSSCLSDTSAQVDVTADDDSGGSGLRRIECRTTPPGGPAGQWRDCSAVPTTIEGLREGLNHLDVRVFDMAGNRAEKPDAVRWFVDSKTPEPPFITVTPQAPDGKNGWRRTLPAIEVLGRDPKPSAGLVGDPITVFVDEGQLECGDDDAGRQDDFAVSRCHPSLAGVGEGDHRLTATVTDRLGHTSGLSEPVTLRTDHKAPRSRLALGPREPDGKGGWWRSRPFVAFTASDGPGGSGLDHTQDTENAGTGIHFSIDGEPYRLHRDDDVPVLLEDGRHEICWYAIDLAGNREDADPDTPGDQSHCRGNILVDSTAPSVADAITPAAPDGEHGFYVTRPTVTMSGGDEGPDPKSGLDRVEYQVDDGRWRAAAPVVVDSGVHTVRVRAFDNAGNPADLLERTVSVDLGDPEAGLLAFPPGPNAQGLFRRPRSYAVSVLDERGGSGAAGARATVDGGAPFDYAGPFPVASARQTVTATARDRAGRTGPSVTTATARLDTRAPAAAPVAPGPTTIVSTLLNIAPTTAMRFTASDPPGPQTDTPPRVKVTVVVLDVFANVVRRIPVPGSYAGGFRDAGAGVVAWNGRNDAGRAVLPGVYHYRVQATDEAGNTVTSTESATFLVIQGLI